MRTLHVSLAVLLAATLACAGRKAGPPVTEVHDPAGPGAAAARASGDAAAPGDARGGRPATPATLEVKVVHFGFDEYLLGEDDREALARLARSWPGGATAVIAGHSDERGTTQYNIALGERRANAVKEYLVALGVPAASLRTVSHGEEQPAAGGHDEGAWAKNRRAELDVAAPAVSAR